MIPGISSGPYGSPFDKVVDSLDGMTVRVDTWEDADDLEEMTLKDLHGPYPWRG